MPYIFKALTLLVIFIHIYIMILEMVLWTTPRVMKIFRMNSEQALSTKVMAMNQGLYNGFLAAGLIWGLSLGALHITFFFLICVMVAGIFGALTANKRIFFIQALPAILALLAGALV